MYVGPLMLQLFGYLTGHGEPGEFALIDPFPGLWPTHIGEWQARRFGVIAT